MIDNQTWSWIAFLTCIVGATIIGTFGTFGAGWLIFLAFILLITIFP